MYQSHCRVPKIMFFQVKIKICCNSIFYSWKTSKKCYRIWYQLLTPADVTILAFNIWYSFVWKMIKDLNSLLFSAKTKHLWVLGVQKYVPRKSSYFRRQRANITALTVLIKTTLNNYLFFYKWTSTICFKSQKLLSTRQQ